VIDGWAIVDIDASGIVIQEPGRTVSLRLYPADASTARIEPRFIHQKPKR
jgi:hypothetical protein